MRNRLGIEFQLFISLSATVFDGDGDELPVTTTLNERIEAELFLTHQQVTYDDTNELLWMILNSKFG